MTSPNPYEQLGVTESASFEEIQDARNRLVTQYEGDRKQVELIEAAYDSVLMDRLRLRQEGKIKVPDRIRFPEKIPAASPSPAPVPTASGSSWLQSLIDTPSWVDIFLPAGLLSLLSALVFLYSLPGVAGQQLLQSVWMLATGITFYFLFRKERKFGRSVLLTFTALVVGLAIGYSLMSPLSEQIRTIGKSVDVFATLIMFVFLWLTSSFLR
jgi:hypothetical protein